MAKGNQADGEQNGLETTKVKKAMYSMIGNLVEGIQIRNRMNPSRLV